MPLLNRIDYTGRIADQAVSSSVTAPVLNEEEVLPTFYERVRDALEGVEFELVLVDDGSTDRSPELLDEIAREGRPGQGRPLLAELRLPGGRHRRASTTAAATPWSRSTPTSRTRRS